MCMCECACECECACACECACVSVHVSECVCACMCACVHVSMCVDMRKGSSAHKNNTVLTLATNLVLCVCFAPHPTQIVAMNYMALGSTRIWS